MSVGTADMHSWFLLNVISKRRSNVTKRRIENKYKRKTIITLRLTDMELATLDKACQNVNLSRSAYIRELIMHKTPQIHFDVVADMSELRRLVGEYGKIGSNLNQIAKHFNSGGERSLVIQDEILQCINELFSLSKEVLKLAGDLNGNSQTYKK